MYATTGNALCQELSEDSSGTCSDGHQGGSFAHQVTMIYGMVCADSQHVMELQCLPGPQTNERLTAYARSAEEAVKLVSEAAGKSFNVYYGVNPRTKDCYTRAPGRWVQSAKGISGTNEDVCVLRNAFFDIDPVRAQGFEKHASTKAELIKCLEAGQTFIGTHQLQGSADVIISGNGIQLVILVNVPIEFKDRYQIWHRDMCKKFQHDGVKLDPTSDARRLGRMPGVLNTSKTAVAGRPHRIAQVLSEESSSICVNWQREIAATDLSSKAPKSFTEGPLPDRWDEVLRNDEKARSRWGGDTSGLNDASGSGLDFALAIIAVGHGFDDGDIFRILKHFEHGSKNEALRNPSRYYQRTIANARAVAGSDGFDPSQIMPFARIPNLSVLGHNDDMAAVLFDSTTGLHEVDLGKWQYVNALLVMGDPLVTYTENGKHFSGFRENLAIAARCRRLDTEKYYGDGIWYHDGEILFASNGKMATLASDFTVKRLDCPIWNNRLVRTSGKTGYDPLSTLQEAAAMSADDVRATCGELIQYLRNWNYKGSFVPELLSGLVMATFIQDVWPFRPQVYLTGRTHTGKSQLLESLEAIFGPLAMLRDGKTSEAAIRQSLATQEQILLIDEFEKNHHRDRVLELLRSSSRGHTISKGTQNHNPVNFLIKCIAWVASIEVGLENAADRNRFIVCELLPLSAEARPPAKAGLKELGAKLLSASISISGRALARANELRIADVHGADPRLVEILAIPVALLTEAGIVDDPSTILTEIALDQTGSMGQASDADEVGLLDAILDSHIRVSGITSPATYSVRQILEEKLEDSQAHRALEQSGIYIDGTGIIISQDPVKRYLLKDTKWSRLNIYDFLKRIPGALQDQFRLKNNRIRGVKLPLNSLQADREG